MGIFRQYSDEELQSHFEKLSVDEFEKLKSWTHAKAFKILEHKPGAYLDWHPENGTFLVIILSGKLEVYYTDGTTLLCQPGDLRVASDEGKGHSGRVIGDEPCVVLLVDINK